MNIRDCKGCIYFAKHYGNKSKIGEREVSKYWCVKKQGFIHSFPKKCQFKSRKES